LLNIIVHVEIKSKLQDKTKFIKFVILQVSLDSPITPSRTKQPPQSTFRKIAPFALELGDEVQVESEPYIEGPSNTS
jgi:hypothetical protein